MSSLQVLNLVKNDIKFLLHFLSRIDPENEHIVEVVDFFSGITQGKKNLHKLCMRINCYFKEGERASKISKPYLHKWVPGIEEDDISKFKSQENLFGGVPIQFVVANRPHQTLCWSYFRSLCYLSDMYLMKVLQEKKTEEKNKQKAIICGLSLEQFALKPESYFNELDQSVREELENIDIPSQEDSDIADYHSAAKEKFRECLVNRVDYEHDHDINQIIDRELLNDSKKKTEDAIKAANKVKELFNKNSKSDRVINTIVDSLANKLGNMEDDDDNGFLGLINVAREVAMDVGGKVRKEDVDMEELMKRSREAGAKVYQKTPDHEKDKIKSNPMMRDLVKNLENPESEINIKELQGLMDKYGINPMEAARKLGVEDKLKEMQSQLEIDGNMAEDGQVSESIEEMMAAQLKKK